MGRKMGKEEIKIPSFLDATMAAKANTVIYDNRVKTEETEEVEEEIKIKVFIPRTWLLELYLKILELVVCSRPDKNQRLHAFYPKAHSFELIVSYFCKPWLLLQTDL